MLESPEELQNDLEIPEQTAAQCDNWKARSKDHNVRIKLQLCNVMLMLIFYPVQPYRLALIFSTFSDLNDALFSYWDQPTLSYYAFMFTRTMTLYEHSMYRDVITQFYLSFHYVCGTDLGFGFTSLAPLPDTK